jgi:ABC-type amino acid transport substrate-binding protein
MKKWLLIFCSLVSFAVSAQEPWVRKTIKVGGYVWEPVVFLSGRNYQGLTLDLIDAANKAQGDFEFEFVLTTPENRYRDFQQGKFDMIFFEDIDWGWNAHPVNATIAQAKGTELYIALNTSGRDQRFFQNIKEKNISAVKGFHYSFAGSNTSEDYLKKHFKIRLHDQSSLVLEDILDEKSEIGVINSLYLQYAIVENYKIEKQLLIGQKFDQDFTLSTLVRKNSAMTVAQMNVLLNRLKDEGVLKAIWDKYQLNPNVSIEPLPPKEVQKP